MSKAKKYQPQLLVLGLMIFLLIEPFIISYAISGITGITKVIPYTLKYNANNTLVYTTTYNGSTASSLVIQDVIYDNYTIIIPTLNFSVVPNAIEYNIFISVNTTKVFDSNLDKVIIKIDYQGTGNITNILLQCANTYTSASLYNILLTNDAGESNYTLEYRFETFQIYKIISYNYTRFKVQFTDTLNLPSQNDYFEITIIFVKTTTIISKKTLTNILVGVFAVINIIIAIFMTKIVSVKKLLNITKKRKHR